MPWMVKRLSGPPTEDIAPEAMNAKSVRSAIYGWSIYYGPDFYR